MNLARRLLLACLATLPCACASTGSPVPEGSGDGAGELSIVSLNLYHDKADWPKRRGLVIAGLRELDPDVVVLQEVLQHEGLRNQAEDLAEALGYHAYFASVDPAPNTRRYGNAILSRTVPLATDWTALRPYADARNAAHARIRVDGHTVNVYAVHPNYRNDAEGAAMRRQQFADLLDFVRRTAGDAPGIIAGDFNATSDRPEMAVFAEGHANAFEQVHADARAPSDPHTTLNPAFFAHDHRRIDHVYLPRGQMQAIEARIVLDQPDAGGHWPSDHFGLYVRARFTAPR